MRHNPALALVFLLFVNTSVFAEKEKPQLDNGNSKLKNEGNVEQARTEGKNSKKTDPGKDSADLDQIDESWMQAIHSDAKDPASGKAEEKSNSEESTTDVDQGEPVRLQNPSSGGIFGNNTEEPEGPSFISVFLRFIGLLGAMLGIFYIVMKYLRNKGVGVGGTQDLVSVVATVPLMQGRFIQIVDMAGKLLVLGVAESGVQLVLEVEDARTLDKIRMWQSGRPAVEAGPEPLAVKLVKLIKGTDFKLWEGKKENPFREILSKDTGMDSSKTQSDLETLLQAQKDRLKSRKV